VNDETASVLEGTWQGDYSSGNNWGTFNDTVALTINPGAPRSGRFKMGRGAQWRTGVVLRDGKVVMGIDRASREWELERESDGALRLRARYTNLYQGNIYDVTVELKKTGSTSSAPKADVESAGHVALTTPLPKNAAVLTPFANVPANLAAFSGRWAVMWSEGFDGGLVVELVTPTYAEVIYSWGRIGGFRPGWTRVRGEFVDGALRLKLRRPATVTYRMRPDGKLDATYEWSGGTSTATLTKVGAS
jgi:hypothetical protein